MIEVERKFLLKDGDFERLTKNATLIGEKSFTDTYYDTDDYLLTAQDIWLRSRDGQFELKTPIGKVGERSRTDQYDEATEEPEIVKKLQLSGASLSAALENAGIKPFATFTSHRKKFKSGDFILDFDTTDFNYSIGEIEIMVENKEDIPGALEKIEDFASANNLSLTAVRGKLIELIKRNSPKHYDKLVTLGVISEEQAYN